MKKLIFILILMIMPLTFLALGEVSPFPVDNPAGSFIGNYIGRDPLEQGSGNNRWLTSEFPYINQILPPTSHRGSLNNEFILKDLFLSKKETLLTFSHSYGAENNLANNRTYIRFSDLVDEFPFFATSWKDNFQDEYTKTDFFTYPELCKTNSISLNCSWGSFTDIYSPQSLIMFKNEPEILFEQQPNMVYYEFKLDNLTYGVDYIMLGYVSSGNNNQKLPMLLSPKDYDYNPLPNLKYFGRSTTNNTISMRPEYSSFDLPMQNQNGDDTTFDKNIDLWGPPSNYQKIEIPNNKKLMVNIPKMRISHEIWFDTTTQWEIGLWNSEENNYVNKRSGLEVYNALAENILYVVVSEAEFQSDMPLILSIPNWTNEGELVKNIWLPKSFEYQIVDALQTVTCFGDVCVGVDNSDHYGNNTYSSLFNLIKPGPVDALLTLPLKLLNELKDNISNSNICVPVVVNLPFVNRNIHLPCMSTFYQNIGIVPFLNTISTVAGTILLYNYFRNLFWWAYGVFTFKKSTSAVWGDDNV